MNNERQEWICYDADCARCVRWAGRLRGLCERHGFTLILLQSPDARARLRMPENQLLAEMRVITREGIIFGGGDALIYLSSVICRPLFALTFIPGVKPLLRSVYRFLARHRSCAAGNCPTQRVASFRVGNPADGLPLLVFPPTAAVIGKEFPAWIYMWLLALALFYSCKWLCLRMAMARGVHAGLGRKIGFLFGWVGMDAEDFLTEATVPEKPRTTAWLAASLKTFSGAILIWMGARAALTIDPLLAGWTGMVGIILLLHFGLFRLLALAWHAAGVAATPLMQAPLLSRSLGEFWGRRWNTAFHELTARFLFNPLRRAMGIRAAILLAFLASGLLHDLVISVPAGGGYGLPTLYFLLQGAGVLFERTKIARRLGLGRGIRGWLFMLLITAGPAFWLFHPPFVHYVILPMLHAIGAI
ncbi:MAG TPA: DCC1-like thiol-disulfide oxidoreductase family protein [Verrucomicrobiae bacterium]|nr:DCC1-like thiol-disulfide oxidoreductase family protein [Verrucomicrobiae bacterium]